MKKVVNKVNKQNEKKNYHIKSSCDNLSLQGRVIYPKKSNNGEKGEKQ